MKTTHNDVRVLIDCAIARQAELFHGLDVNDSTQQTMIERIQAATARATLECVRDAFAGNAIFLKLLGAKGLTP